MVKSLRAQCIELLTEIEARLDFDDEMPPLDLNLIMDRIQTMSQDVQNALDTANYDKLLQSGLQVLTKRNYLKLEYIKDKTFLLSHMQMCTAICVALT